MEKVHLVGCSEQDSHISLLLWWDLWAKYSLHPFTVANPCSGCISCAMPPPTQRISKSHLGQHCLVMQLLLSFRAQNIHYERVTPHEFFSCALYLFLIIHIQGTHVLYWFSWQDRQSNQLHSAHLGQFNKAQGHSVTQLLAAYLYDCS